MKPALDRDDLLFWPANVSLVERGLQRSRRRQLQIPYCHDRVGGGMKKARDIFAYFDTRVHDA